MKKIAVTTFFILTLTFGSLFPQRAHALFGVGDIVVDPTNLVQNTINASNSILEYAKEYVLDGLAWQLANVALEQMTQDIVAYINSGFNGSPAFLQNPSRFFEGIADNVAGDFLQEIGGGFLCSPFQADIQFALEIGYYQSGGRTDLQDRYACTLSDALGNVEDFLNNDLSQGGLDQFFNIAVRPENNPYVLGIDLQRELDGRIFGRLQGEEQILGWNGGFLSRRECLPGEEEPNCSGDILTPGDTIQNQLNESLGIGRDRLVVADDINEIVSALMNQLVSQAIGGASGLLGLSTSSGGSSSYFDQTNNPGVEASDRDRLENQLTSGVTSGNRANRILDRVIRDAPQVNQILSAAQAAGTCSPENIQDLQDLAFEATLYRTDAITTQDIIDNGIRELQRLIGNLAASNSRTEYLVIAQEYQELLQNNSAPTEGTVAQADGVESQVSSLILQAESIFSSCGS